VSASAHAAAIKPADKAWLALRPFVLARLVFGVVQVHLQHPPAHAGHRRMRAQEFNGQRQKPVEQLHVAIDQVNELPARVLIAQLRADAAAALLRMRQLNNAHREAAGNLDGAVA
jgi:hypothetical protein